MRLFHHSPTDNRESILRLGLLSSFDRTGDETSFSGVYLTTSGTSTCESDVYQVDATGLQFDDDWSQSDDEQWYVVYGDIPPDRITLIGKPTLLEETAR